MLKTDESSSAVVSPVMMSNTAGLIGASLTLMSVFGWGILLMMTVSYDVPQTEPELTGDAQRDLIEQAGTALENNGRKAAAVAANTLTTFVGGTAVSVMLILGMVICSVGLTLPQKTLPTIGILVGGLSIVLGVSYFAWRYTLWIS